MSKKQPITAQPEPKIDNSKNPNLNRVYVDRFGYEWYAHRNPLDISAHRGFSIEKAKRFLSMKLSEKTLEALLLEQKAKFNAGEFVDAAAITHQMLYRLKFIGEAESMLDLVFVYYFLKDEDPEVPSDYHRDLKQRILMSDPIARTFFLRIAVTLSSKLCSLPEEDLLRYLAQTEAEAERLYQFISRQNPIGSTDSSSNLSTTPTKDEPPT